MPISNSEQPLAAGCKLDIKNPHGQQDLERVAPYELAESILQKELRIAEIMGEIKALLETGV